MAAADAVTHTPAMAYRCGLSTCVLVALLAALPAYATTTTTDSPRYDVLISGATVYDGSGGAAFIGDVAISGDRIAYVGPHAPHAARERLDAHGKAVSPGFVNMLAHPEESLLADGRALSDLRQGVTLEVMGEDSMGPLTPEMKQLDAAAPGRHQVSPSTGRRSGDYLRQARDGAASRPTSLRSSAQARCAPTCWARRTCSRRRRSSRRCSALVQQAMEEGALGVTTALIYSPERPMPRRRS